MTRPPRPPAVLVAGGSRVLRDAAAALTRTAEVTVTTRGLQPLPPSVRRLRLDTGAAAGVVPGAWDAALLYAPAVDERVAARIAAATNGPVVLIVTSAAAATPGPAALAARVGAIPVLLGWTGPPARPRWHTPAEIGRAALVALHERRPVRLGRLHGQRP